MRILAIDTSCGAASVAVLESGRAEPLWAVSRAMARGHAEALAPMVEDAARHIEGGLASLDRIAVTTGPGSFTGIRVGLALARAMVSYTKVYTPFQRRRLAISRAAILRTSNQAGGRRGTGAGPIPAHQESIAAAGDPTSA